MIFDEVMTSRVHSGGLQAHFGVKPDLVTLGKYIAGGLTIGAFGGRADIMERFDPARPDAFPHGGTFNNNVVAMAAGYAALTKLLTTRRHARMNDLGDGCASGSMSWPRKHDLPMVATGFGSIFGIHFHDGHDPQYRRSGSAASTDARKQIADLKKLFHLDMLAAGHYIARRIMGNLSLETSEAGVRPSSTRSRSS